MKPWKQDRVVGRTLAFVESIIASRPAPADHEPADWDSVRPDRFARRDAGESATERAAQAAIDTGGQTSPALLSSASPPGISQRIDDIMQAERTEILRRVAAFRELQVKLRREREQYCDAITARTRAALEQQPKRTLT